MLEVSARQIDRVCVDSSRQPPEKMAQAGARVQDLSCAARRQMGEDLLETNRAVTNVLGVCVELGLLTPPALVVVVAKVRGLLGVSIPGWSELRQGAGGLLPAATCTGELGAAREDFAAVNGCARRTAELDAQDGYAPALTCAGQATACFTASRSEERERFRSIAPPRQ